MTCICYDVVIYILSNWFRSNSLFTSNRMHYLKTPTTKLLQSRVLFSHFSRINQKRFFEFDWTFYFIPITRNDIFCKRKRHTYLAGVQHSIRFQQYIFTQPKLWQQAKIKTTFYFMHNTIIGRGNVFHFHVAENKCLIFPRAVSRLIKK